MAKLKLEFYFPIDKTIYIGYNIGERTSNLITLR